MNTTEALNTLEDKLSSLPVTNTGKALIVGSEEANITVTYKPRTNHYIIDGDTCPANRLPQAVRNVWSALADIM